ncbi:MAG: hypothetical protein J6S14_19000 [Clostridia bacterium]|nr:hypothetical protein [Clostridia bacterium]
MKRYNINWYNGWKILIDLVYIPLLIICVPFVWTIICVWWLIFSDNLAIPTLACAILAVAVILITLYFGLANRFYYDENNQEIILKLIHQQPRRIPIRDIALVSRKINTNKDKGPVTHYGKNDAYEHKTYGVSDAEGRDYFYIKDDPILFEFFENLKINVKRKEE